MNSEKNKNEKVTQLEENWVHEMTSMNIVVRKVEHNESMIKSGIKEFNTANRNYEIKYKRRTSKDDSVMPETLAEDFDKYINISEDEVVILERVNIVNKKDAEILIALLEKIKDKVS